MAFGTEAAHIDTDLRHDHLGREAADTRNGGQHLDGCEEGSDVGVDLLVDAGDGRIQGIELIQMKSQHEAMMGRHPAMQRRLQLRRSSLEAPVG